MADRVLSDQLCNASARGDLSEVRDLLDKVDVNGLNTYNRTALQVVKLGNSTLVQVLLDAGAGPNVRDPACGLTVTHDAAREGYVDSVRVLVNNGADVNLADNRGNLPLHLAAGEGYLEVVELLLGRTANPQKANDEGDTAGQLARRRGKMETAAFIDVHLGFHLQDGI
ncbi:cyclin-dependent kinase 4 inhibitor C isoform X1 [Brachyistius frenatus]|uniref:cyclin-dependent kinase 4 inhibitor C isoform X1 n=2 Tax=Brachyistius frenatus TaxID=100188 RepID=UPI0037E7CBF7